MTNATVKLSKLQLELIMIALQAEINKMTREVVLRHPVTAGADR